MSHASTTSKLGRFFKGKKKKHPSASSSLLHASSDDEEEQQGEQGRPQKNKHIGQVKSSSFASYDPSYSEVASPSQPYTTPSVDNTKGEADLTDSVASYSGNSSGSSSDDSSSSDSEGNQRPPRKNQSQPQAQEDAFSPDFASHFASKAQVAAIPDLNMPVISSSETRQQQQQTQPRQGGVVASSGKQLLTPTKAASKADPFDGLTASPFNKMSVKQQAPSNKQQRNNNSASSSSLSSSVSVSGQQRQPKRAVNRSLVMDPVHPTSHPKSPITTKMGGASSKPKSPPQPLAAQKSPLQQKVSSPPEQMHALQKLQRPRQVSTSQSPESNKMHLEATGQAGASAQHAQGRRETVIGRYQMIEDSDDSDSSDGEVEPLAITRSLTDSGAKPHSGRFHVPSEHKQQRPSTARNAEIINRTRFRRSVSTDGRGNETSHVLAVAATAASAQDSAASAPPVLKKKTFHVKYHVLEFADGTEEAEGKKLDGKKNAKKNPKKMEIHESDSSDEEHELFIWPKNRTFAMKISRLPASDVTITPACKNLIFCPAHLMFTGTGALEQKFMVKMRQNVMDTATDALTLELRVEYDVTGTDAAYFATPPKENIVIVLSKNRGKKPPLAPSSSSSSSSAPPKGGVTPTDVQGNHPSSPGSPRTRNASATSPDISKRPHLTISVPTTIQNPPSGPPSRGTPTPASHNASHQAILDTLAHVPGMGNNMRNVSVSSNIIPYNVDSESGASDDSDCWMSDCEEEQEAEDTQKTEAVVKSSPSPVPATATTTTAAVAASSDVVSLPALNTAAVAAEAKVALLSHENGKKHLDRRNSTQTAGLTSLGLPQAEERETDGAVGADGQLRRVTVSYEKSNTGRDVQIVDDDLSSDDDQEQQPVPAREPGRATPIPADSGPDHDRSIVVDASKRNVWGRSVEDRSASNADSDVTPSRTSPIVALSGATKAVHVPRAQSPPVRTGGFRFDDETHISRAQYVVNDQKAEELRGISEYLGKHSVGPMDLMWIFQSQMASMQQEMGGMRDELAAMKERNSKLWSENVQLKRKTRAQQIELDRLDERKQRKQVKDKRIFDFPHMSRVEHPESGDRAIVNHSTTSTANTSDVSGQTTPRDHFHVAANESQSQQQPKQQKLFSKHDSSQPAKLTQRPSILGGVDKQGAATMVMRKNNSFSNLQSQTQQHQQQQQQQQHTSQNQTKKKDEEQRVMTTA